MTKDREPYVCDAPGCGKRRSSDANHWWLIRFARLIGGSPKVFIEILPWNAALADEEGTGHACGVGCMAVVVQNKAAQLVDESKKEAASGTA